MIFLARIMIVEDEIIEAMDIKNHLVSLGHEVIYIAPSGIEAIEKAMELSPDLVLMDIVLKGDLDGIETAKRIKNLNIPLIYLTAHPDEATVNRALTAEPYAYLLKPFDRNVLKFTIDVSLYKDQMEKKLIKSQEDYYQTIFENTAAATIVSEEDTVISLVNPEFETLSGYSKEEIEGKMKWTEFVIEEDLEIMKEYHRLRRVNPDLAPQKYETRLVNKKGAIKNVYLTVAVIPNTSKSAISLLDLTDLKKTKNHLKESTEKFKSIFDHAAEAIILFDRNGKILEANDKIEDIAGFPKEELIGENFMKLLPNIEMDMENVISSFKNFVAGEKRELNDMEWTLTNVKGEKLTLIAHPSIIKKNDKIDGMVVILEDVTERKNAENKLKNSLKEKDVLLREVHHRVKNNMQIISSLLSLQMTNIPDADTVNVLRECQGRVRSMAMIHEKLYESPDLSHINFKSYLEKLLSHIRHSYHINTAPIYFDIDVQDLEMGLETALPCGLIVTELVTNSIKYAFPQNQKGEITVKLKSNDEKYELIVSDDGVGLPEDISPETTEKLGLRLVNLLVHQLVGKMKLERNNGTRFIINFEELKYIERI